jgi:hypothetical protein
MIADASTGASMTGWFAPGSSGLECESVVLDPGYYGFYHYDQYADGYVYNYVDGTNLGYFYFDGENNYSWGYAFTLEAQSCDDAAACNYGDADACTYPSGGFNCDGSCNATLTTVDLYVASYGSEKAWSPTEPLAAPVSDHAFSDP